MNTLVRPAMYDAYHKIESINNKSDKNILYAVAGPICESSDIFQKKKNLPKQSIGDLLVI